MGQIASPGRSGPRQASLGAPRAPLLGGVEQPSLGGKVEFGPGWCLGHWGGVSGARVGLWVELDRGRWSGRQRLVVNGALATIVDQVGGRVFVGAWCLGWRWLAGGVSACRWLVVSRLAGGWGGDVFRPYRLENVSTPACVAPGAGSVWGVYGRGSGAGSLRSALRAWGFFGSGGVLGADSTQNAPRTPHARCSDRSGSNLMVVWWAIRPRTVGASGG